MNRNAIAFVFSTLVLLIGYFYLSQHYAGPKTATAPAAQEIASPVVAATQIATPIAAATITSASPSNSSTTTTINTVRTWKPEDLKLDSALTQVGFSELGGCINQYQLKEYSKDASAKTKEPVDLFSGYAVCKSFGTRWGDEDLRNMPAQFERNGRKISAIQKSHDVEIRRTFEFEENDYGGKLTVEVKNLGTVPAVSSVGIELGAASEHKDSAGMFAAKPMQNQGISFLENDKLTTDMLAFSENPAAEEILRKTAFSPDWIGSSSHYFIAALMPQSKESGAFLLRKTGFNIQINKDSPATRTVYDAWYDIPVNLAPGSTKTMSYDLYFGPKLKSRIDRFESKGLTRAIDFGFFRIISWPMYTVMHLINKWIGNWGASIIIFTLLIKLIFYPLGVKAYVAGRKMQKVQPELNAIKEKYKDDKQKQQQEMMAAMAGKGVNPMSGCLPILPQLPVFFGLNAVLTQTFELRQAPFALWFSDLSARDPYFISPILMAGLMVMQQKMTPVPSMDPAQARMMKFMPIMFAVFMVSYPSGLVLYIMTNTIVSMAQQQYMMRKYKDV